MLLSGTFHLLGWPIAPFVIYRFPGIPNWQHQNDVGRVHGFIFNRHFSPSIGDIY
jgi:hypothetical protein